MGPSAAPSHEEIVMSAPALTSGPTRRWSAGRGHVRELRYLAAVLAALTAGLYAVIATGVVTVLEGPADQVAATQTSFGVPAAIAYALGVFLLLRYDRWIVWVLGALLQMLVVAAYFNVAGERVPAFEMWGITIRVLQIALLAVLVALAIRASTRRGSGDVSA
jgi:hypothetical protein